jgi:excinuclease ABC subunit A
LACDRIELRGVRVHNLHDVDLDIPHGQLIVCCGVSGSGKTSLALDTLYAEGQRRYIESFSAYTRQFLERLERPDADRIDGIPPAIAVTHKNASRSSRATIGTTTEIIDYLRLLYARIGQIRCHQCDRPVRKDSPQTASEHLQQLPDGTRYLVTYPVTRADEAEQTMPEMLTTLREDGFVRVVLDHKVVNLNETDSNEMTANGELLVVVDRLSAGKTEGARLRDSLETAFIKGRGRCHVLARVNGNGAARPSNAWRAYALDDQDWWQVGFSERLTCENCHREFPRQEPRLFSFNSPLGACPECEGFGDVMDIDMDLVVPNPNKSLSEGAIAPWNTPAYAHELSELLALADDYNIPINTPFRDLDESCLRLIHDGVPERDFGGLRGFFAWLERRKYKMHIRVFLSRWRSYRTCTTCHAARLKPEALATRIGGKNIAELCQLEIRDALALLEEIALTPHEKAVGGMLLDQVTSRLGYLDSVGLGYLSLDRPLRTLSNGEAQRVTLTSALGSNLVNMLYVLDEPSVGLHPTDVRNLLSAIHGLCERGNTIVVVEHEESLIRTADHVIEVGPGAGEDGGEITFQGTPEEMISGAGSFTGDYLAGRRGAAIPERRRETTHGWIKIKGAGGNNLKHLEIEFPLGVLCLVTGVSGSGKSSLVEHTLYPALCRRKRKEGPKPLPYDDVFGDGQIDDVLLIDQSPIGRSARSNPVTYIKAFDPIRQVFAETLTARTHNYSASYFSFNVDGGRCDTCKGEGRVEIDMQFFADVSMKCSECQGRRYRREILEVTYRNRSIADVLEMTVREAFTFFRGQTKVQVRLKHLIDVGLDYLRLGQPANTLSAGEAQRLKLAGHIASSKRARTLFLLDEPTTGLHFADIVQLLDCFDALLNVGHSLIVVEHNPQMMKAADYIVDLGPGAADAGGRLVAQGTPEEVARCQGSATGNVLRRELKKKETED